MVHGAEQFLARLGVGGDDVHHAGQELLAVAGALDEPVGDVTEAQDRGGDHLGAVLAVDGGLLDGGGAPLDGQFEGLGGVADLEGDVGDAVTVLHHVGRGRVGGGEGGGEDDLDAALAQQQRAVVGLSGLGPGLAAHTEAESGAEVERGLLGISNIELDVVYGPDIHAKPFCFHVRQEKVEMFSESGERVNQEIRPRISL